MKLLITPALSLNEEEKRILREKHEVFFLDTELVPVSELNLDFSLGDIEGIVCNHFFLYNDIVLLPKLKVIQLTSVGLDRIPLKRIKERNISVYNAGSVYAIPMAEWAVCKILEMYKCSGFFYDRQKQHIWEKNRQIRELNNTTAVIVGCGNVGRKIAERLKPFGVTIIGVDIIDTVSGSFDKWYHISEIEKALCLADTIILTLPLTEQTRHIMDDQKLSAIREGATLINVSRGAVIDQIALEKHLKSGHLGGAALDVFETEPLPESCGLWSMDNVIITPHNSFVGNGNRERLFSLICNNLSAR